MKKLLVVLLSVLAICVLFGLVSCSDDDKIINGDDTRPKLSLSSGHGSPGTEIRGSVEGTGISVSNALILVDSIPALVFAQENQSFSFLVPLLSAGQYNVALQGSMGTVSSTVTFTVDQQPTTGAQPGQITENMIFSATDIVDVISASGDELMNLGILSSSELATLNEDLGRANTLLNTMQSEFADLPDSVKTMVDAFLYSAGMSDILGEPGSSLRKSVSELRDIVTSSTPVDTFRVLVSLDALSMALSDLKAGLTLSAVAIIVASGGTATPAAGAIAAINFSISLIDNIIDGSLPTDLDHLEVTFSPDTEPELNVGEQASVIVRGMFATQKDPVDATVDIILSGAFYGIGDALSEQLDGVLTQLSLKFAQVMAVSLDDYVTNVEQVALPHLVTVDINYFEKDMSQIMLANGMSALLPGLTVALDLISLVTPSFAVNPLVFNTNIVSYSPTTGKVTALTTGTLDDSNVRARAWVCNGLCEGWYSFLCFGAEWPEVIEDQMHVVSSIEIVDAETETNSNVALQSNGGTASAISVGTYLGQTQYAYYANDGTSSTSWSDNWDMPAWLKIEFDKTYTIDSVGIWWASHRHTFSISVSTDGTNWNTVVPSRVSINSEGSQPVHESFSISSASAKYIKIDITTTSAPASHIFQASVGELEAFGH